ncbi:MAG: hypothetical protein ACU0BF_01275 [Paracoccaceae bacterium]
MSTELELAAILCLQVLGGEPETRSYFDVVDDRHHVRVDCETDTHVIEVGLDDTRSSYDSLHQALFAAHRTGKAPMVVIVDTNGRLENAEYQVETVARAAGVAYAVYDRDFLLRWQMTEPFRQARRATLARSAMN